jgi:hypothetical protein
MARSFCPAVHVWEGIGDKLNLIGSAAGFNVRKLLSLLGTGIFSRVLLVWDGFCRFLSSWTGLVE